MSALAVLATVDRFLAKVYGPRQPKAPPMVACSGLDQRLDVVIDELRGLREATERLVELQAENLRLKVAGPSVELAQGTTLLGPGGALAELSRLADDAADAIEEARTAGDEAELRESMAGRIGKAIEEGQPERDAGDRPAEDMPGEVGGGFVRRVGRRFGAGRKG